MENNKIKPDKITKPIQLLGAWLVGLLTIDSAFLLAATKMDLSTWQSGALTIAAILNVPLFIGALFLLQTKFRPELQEDSYYSTYLSNRTNKPIKVPRIEAVFSELEKRLDAIERNTSNESETLEVDNSILADLSYGINVQLSNKEEILSKLNSHGVLGVSEFGQKSRKPEPLKVAITESISRPALNQLLKLAQSLGFTHYGFIESFEDIEEDVLFGAYGEDTRRITSS